MATKSYISAVLPAAGLGNRLFPWARARIYSMLHNRPLLETRWWQVRLGPLLRREADSRWYTSQFVRTDDEVAGLKKAFVDLAFRRVAEPGDLADAPPERGVVSFEGWSNYFTPLLKHQAFLQEELKRAVNPRWMAEVERLGRDLPPIGIHLRRGDFRVATDATQFKTQGAIRTPIEWYVKVLTEIRQIVGKPVRAFVCSDGTEEELAPLLKEQGVVKIDGGAAVADLLLLSRSKLILGTGGSSFSGWAAFLGSCPVIVCEGQCLSWFGLDAQSTGGLLATMSLADWTSEDQEVAALAAGYLREGQ